MKKICTKVLSLVLCALMLAPLFVVSAAEVDLASVMTEESYTTVDKTITMPYRMYVPANYDAEKNYSLLLYLHGEEASGNDNAAQIKDNALIERIIAGEFISTNDKEFSTEEEFIIIAPQCPADAKWVDAAIADDGSFKFDETAVSPYMAAVIELVDHTMEKKSLDLSRLYVAGNGMGGYGVWDIIFRNPKMFAAAIAIDAGTDISKKDAISHIPVWAFNQNLSKTVSPASTSQMVEALVNDGADISFTQYFDTEGDSFKKALSEDGLLRWIGSKSTKPDIKIACIGHSNVNSHAANRKYYPEYLNDKFPANVEVRNYGLSGSTALFSTNSPYAESSQYKDALAYNPDVLVMSFGGNDIKDDNWTTGKNYFISDYTKIMDSFKAINPDVKVYMTIDSRIFKLNVYGQRNPEILEKEAIPMLYDLAKKLGLKTINFFDLTKDMPELFPDFIHINAEGAQMFADEAYKVIAPDLDLTQTAKESPVKNASDWAKKELSFLYAAGLGTGTYDLNYTEAITREDFCKAIVSAIPKSVKAVREEKAFTDTKTKAVTRAYALGVVNGMSDTEFAPSAKITREQAAAMLQRAYHLIAPGATATDSVAFADASSISEWAKESTSFISGIGIMKGDDKGNMNPLNNITYQEALLTVYRTYISANTYGK